MDYQHLLISDIDKNGIAEGYMVSTIKNTWKTFLMDTFPQDCTNIIQAIDKRGYTTIAVLKQLYVDEGSRGHGIGRKLFDEFKLQSSYAQILLLCADKTEKQMEGFDLIGWYENHNFYPVVETEQNVLMCQDDDRILYDYTPEMSKKLVVA